MTDKEIEGCAVLLAFFAFLPITALVGMVLIQRAWDVVRSFIGGPEISWWQALAAMTLLLLLRFRITVNREE